MKLCSGSSGVLCFRDQRVSGRTAELSCERRMSSCRTKQSKTVCLLVSHFLSVSIDPSACVQTSCVCRGGYAGDGRHCEMINLCRKVSLGDSCKGTLMETMMRLYWRSTQTLHQEATAGETSCCLRKTADAATTPGVTCQLLESGPAPVSVNTSAMDSPAEALWER